MNSRKGFTLIELLVVVSIISLLSSIVLSSLNTARAKARDARRMADLKQIQTALELYRNDNSGYPSSGSLWRGNCASYGSYPTTGATGYIPNLAPTYISALPLDPKPTGVGTCYLYFSTGADYKVLAHQTTESSCPVPSSHPFWDPPRNGQCTFQVSSSEAAKYAW
jgi:type II secretion system protein G